MHFVGFGFKPLKKPLYAIPLRLPGTAATFPERVPVQHPFLVLRRQIPPGGVDRYVCPFGVFLKLFLTFLVAWCLPGFDGTIAERFGFIRNHKAKVNADDSPKSAARLACTKRRVKREGAWQGFLVTDVALGAVQLVAKTPDSLVGALIVQGVDSQLPLPHAQRLIKCLSHPFGFCACESESVLHHIEREAIGCFGGACRAMHARVSLALKESSHLDFTEVSGNLYSKRHDQAGIVKR